MNSQLRLSDYLKEFVKRSIVTRQAMKSSRDAMIAVLALLANFLTDHHLKQKYRRGGLTLFTPSFEPIRARGSRTAKRHIAPIRQLPAQLPSRACEDEGVLQMFSWCRHTSASCKVIVGLNVRLERLPAA